MITIDKLNDFGANTAEGLNRCFGNETLYLKLVGMIPGEKNFDVLFSSVESREYKKAFEAAHALKGVLGNLSLTPLYESIVEITELLRNSSDVDYSGLIADISSKRAELEGLCE